MLNDYLVTVSNADALICSIKQNGKFNRKLSATAFTQYKVAGTDEQDAIARTIRISAKSGKVITNGLN